MGTDNPEIGSFDEILKTAVKLKAPLIRVWAGDRGSKEADEDWRKEVIRESREIASRASEKDIKIAYEYHDGTLTDTKKSAIKLLNEVDHDNIYCYWQPPHGMDVNSRLISLKEIGEYLTNIHVFYWESHQRYPLIKAKKDWIKYLREVSNLPGTHYAMLEFVKNDDPEQFFEDAKVLKEIVAEVNK